MPDGMVISMKLWFVRRGEACLHAEGVTTKMRTVTEVARTLDYLSDGGKTNYFGLMDLFLCINV